MSTIPSCIQNTFNTAKPYLNTALTEGTDLITAVATRTLATVGLALVFGPSIGIAGGVVCGITAYLSTKSIDPLTYITTSKNTFMSFRAEVLNDLGITLFFSSLTNNTTLTNSSIIFIQSAKDKAAAQSILDLFLGEALPQKEQIKNTLTESSPEFQKATAAFLECLFETAALNHQRKTSTKASESALENFGTATRAFKTPSEAILLILASLTVSKIFLLIFAPIAVVSLTKYAIVSLIGGGIELGRQNLMSCNKQPETAAPVNV